MNKKDLINLLKTTESRVDSLEIKQLDTGTTVWFVLRQGGKEYWKKIRRM